MTDSIPSESMSKVLQVISEMFDTDVEKLDTTSSPDTISRWDSMGHVLLISALEQEFGIVFSPEEQNDMLNVSLVIDTVEGRLGGN